MTKDDYIAFCRYYKGEKENPFTGKDQNKALLWCYESAWVSDTINTLQAGKVLNNNLGEYVSSGLSAFEQTDGVPVTLKALLFNRYAKTSNSLADAVEPFKKFYKEYY